MLTAIGEILIDFLPQITDGRTTGFRMAPGGSPLNVAVGLARLGAPTAFAGKVADDFFARFLRSYVEQEGIDTRFLMGTPGQSTLAFVAMEQGDPAYAFYGDQTADTLLAPGELPPAFYAETRLLHFGSISLLRGSTPAAIVAAAERMRGRALISFDPNVRPGLVRDEPAYRALLDRCIGLTDLLKVSAADLAWLMPGQPPEAAAAALTARGPKLVVVTLGADGGLARRGAEIWRIPPYRVAVVDTVGAGDAFSAGLLAGLAERNVFSTAALASLPADEVTAALRFGGAVAALTCTRAGADPPRRPEVVAFLGAQQP